MPSRNSRGTPWLSRSPPISPLNVVSIISLYIHRLELSFDILQHPDAPRSFRSDHSQKRLLTKETKVEFSYRTIQEVVVSDRPSSLLLTLWEPPRMFEHPDLPNLETLTVQMLYSSQSSTNHTPPKKRVTRIRHDKLDHGAIIGQSLIYCITLEQELVVSHLARLRRIEHLNFTNYCVPVSSSLNCPMLDGWRVFKSTLENLSPIIPFDILYQFQALVQNGYLLPRTAEKLLRRLFENASRTTPANADNSETAIRCPISAEALKSKLPLGYSSYKLFCTRILPCLLRISAGITPH